MECPAAESPSRAIPRRVENRITWRWAPCDTGFESRLQEIGQSGHRPFRAPSPELQERAVPRPRPLAAHYPPSVREGPCGASRARMRRTWSRWRQRMDGRMAGCPSVPLAAGRIRSNALRHPAAAPWRRIRPDSRCPIPDGPRSRSRRKAATDSRTDGNPWRSVRVQATGSRTRP